MRRTVMAMSAVGVVIAILYIIEASRYRIGTSAQPGPGFYPLIVGALLTLGFVGTGIEAATSRSQEEVDWPTGAAQWRVLSIAAASIGYVVLLTRIGHPLAATLVTLVALRVMNMQRWLVAVAVALAIGIGSYYLFAVVLDVPLPSGILPT